MTSDPATHRPKTAALLAYAEDVLSAAGRARLERHLDGCEVCRRELAAIELYDRIVDDARGAPAPEVDFDRMEMTLAREAQRISTEMGVVRRRRSWVPVAVLAAAAAVLLALWVAWPGGGSRAPVAERPEPSPTEAPEAPAPEPASLHPVVTLAAGTAERLAGGEPEALAPGDELDEGARLRTGEASELHVRLRDGTGFVARAGTRVALTEAREDAIRLTLEEGELAQHVATLSNGSTYVVLVSGHEVEVRGTEFVVSYVDGVVAVDLADGVLEVRPPDAEPFELSAPARWRSDGAIVEAGAEDDPIVPRPRELVGAENLTEVTLADERIVRWAIDGTVIPASDVRLRLPDGEHRVEGWDRRNRAFVATFPVRGQPVALEPGALRPEGPHLSPGHLDPEEIAPVLQHGRRQLRSCYEAALRRGSTISGRVRLRVTLDVMGGVRRVQTPDLEGPGADELRQCVTNYVSRWTFPPPGGPMTFEVPLNLTTAY